jgi:hypothetical protein
VRPRMGAHHTTSQGEIPMTAMPMLFSRRAAAVLALAAIAAVFLLSGIAAAKTSYPGSVRKAFNASCVKAAIKGGSISKSDAKAYCNATLVCLEGKVSLAQFAKISTSSAVVKSCEKKAAKKVFS